MLNILHFSILYFSPIVRPVIRRRGRIRPRRLLRLGERRLSVILRVLLNERPHGLQIEGFYGVLHLMRVFPGVAHLDRPTLVTLPGAADSDIAGVRVDGSEGEMTGAGR